MSERESSPACVECGTVLPRSFFNTGVRICPGCAHQCRVDVFPSLFMPQGVESGEKLLRNGDSACFYHPQKKAFVPCDSCGRFLCQLCDINLGDRHLCPQCMQTGRKKGKIRDIENHRILYDDVALSLAIIPMLFIFATIITAPGVLYLTVKHWRAPSSIIPRSRTRFVLASFLALLQISAWILFSVFYIRRHFA